MTSTKSMPSLFLPFLLLLLTVVAADVNELGQESYEIDSSWAIKSTTLTNTLGDKQAVYDKFMADCNEAARRNGQGGCSDRARIALNVEQPQAMRNYTRLGFQKIKTPERVRKLLETFWEANKDDARVEHKHQTTFFNNWENPTTIADVQDPAFQGGGHPLRMEIWDAAKDAIEEWTCQSGQCKYLAHCSIWGIRIYHKGAILAPHVDRNPLVSSAIINVAQGDSGKEPWALEIYGHDEKPYNITMKPGEFVLYESHSAMHGRPFPLQGEYYANIFVHYEVLGSKNATTGELYFNDEDQESFDAGLPPYILPGTPFAEKWKRLHPRGWELFTPISPHRAAETNNVKDLQILSVLNKTSLTLGDQNAWQPIHLAARSGHVEAVDFLITRGGADVNALTNSGKTPLDIAVSSLGEEHAVSELLRDASDESNEEL